MNWIPVIDRLPPAATLVLVYRAELRFGDKMGSTFISTRPRECVEDECISHWMPLPPPPVSGVTAIDGAQPVAWANAGGLERMEKARTGYVESPLLTVNAKYTDLFTVPLYLHPPSGVALPRGGEHG